MSTRQSQRQNELTRFAEILKRDIEMIEKDKNYPISLKEFDEESEIRYEMVNDARDAMKNWMLSRDFHLSLACRLQVEFKPNESTGEIRDTMRCVINEIIRCHETRKPTKFLKY